MWKHRAGRVLRCILGTAGALALVALAGCANVRGIPYTYTPASTISADGAVALGDFSYDVNRQPDASPSLTPGASQPVQTTTRRRTDVKPNQIRNTAMGDILLEKDIKDVMHDATFTELRFVGIKLGANQPRVLTASIQDFLCDDLGYSVDWTLSIEYMVTDTSTGQRVYDGTKKVQRKTAKFANVFGALNDVLRLNIEELLKDPAFLAAIPVSQGQPVAATAPAVSPVPTLQK
ncbi:hypothetical protein AKI39_07815 [Bordetella sp. H567]|uniref:hypothetical protein n=1 Tax=Bordetella sp. H567 TaxID=1697043 RepID=UPI00081CF1EB|nr:hypothetical protein [Bordetella sp. H567]AOB30616.1 hypothetical protein AKI39_07815 [Bordetella sp. H567]